MVLVVGQRLSSCLQIHWPFNEDLEAINNYNTLFEIFSKFHWHSFYQFLSAGPLHQRTEPYMHHVDPFLEVPRDG